MTSALQGRNMLTGLFVILTLALGVVAGMGAVNYYRFYSALTQIQAGLVALHWNPMNSTGQGPTLETDATFRIQNPTGYSGLEVTGFEIGEFDVLSESQNISIPQGSIPTIPLTKNLDPGISVTIDLPAFNTTSDAARLASRTQVMFVFDANVLISSFVNRMGLLQISYKCTSQGQPTGCIQAGVIIVTASGGSGGAAPCNDVWSCKNG